MINDKNDAVQEGRLPLHYAATREELKPIYTALVSKGEYHHDYDSTYLVDQALVSKGKCHHDQCCMYRLSAATYTALR